PATPMETQHNHFSMEIPFTACMEDPRLRFRSVTGSVLERVRAPTLHRFWPLEGPESKALAGGFAEKATSPTRATGPSRFPRPPHPTLSPRGEGAIVFPSPLGERVG